MSNNKEYKFIGTHADELDGGRPIAPGDYLGPIDVSEGHNKDLHDSGVMIEVPDGTAEAVAKIEEAAASKAAEDEAAQTAAQSEAEDKTKTTRKGS